jgi:hypothetical protein
MTQQTKKAEKGIEEQISVHLRELSNKTDFIAATCSIAPTMSKQKI